mmetsp:Transcript_15175/g.31379  ORF Transcript_15175/g.31379 Transcript_15175/m.31379 type:complete len:305 (-) Transcript_15175:706-1620(-)
MSSEMAMQWSMSLHFTAKLCRRAASAVLRLGSGRASTCEATLASISSMRSESVLSRMARATTSCSAWAMRSAATTPALAVSSQMTRTSEGPASMSIPHLPLTMDLAAVTHMLPGPQMTSQGGTVFLAVDFQSKGHGGDRLGSPDPQKDVGTGHVRGREGDGVRFGAAQDDGLAPGGPGRYGRHQHAGRQRVSPAGGVAAGGSTGTDGVTGLPPRNVHLGVGDGVPLQLGKGLDAAVHVVENGSLGFVEAVVGPLALLRGHDQVPHGATRVDVPQALGDLQERGRIHSRASATSIGIGIGISAVL